jgi:hypothetical protein
MIEVIMTVIGVAIMNITVTGETMVTMAADFLA